MSRCIDDHPDAICLCESEVNRALFPDHFMSLHMHRMIDHGFRPVDFAELLDRKKQNDIASYVNWFSQVFPRAKKLYNKPNAKIIGDKSPDFFNSKELINWMALRHPTIYTVRDPRAILRSIAIQTDSSDHLKGVRWRSLIENFVSWETHLNNSNVLISRYEDLIANPTETMAKVYDHLELENSTRFLEPFERLYPKRFLWKTAINWQTGIREDFDKRRAAISDDDLGEMQLEMIYKDAVIQRFMQRFGYGK